MRAAMFRGTQRFHVLETLGKGGMGVIYRARDEEMQRDIALKTLRRGSSDDLYRLKQEFRALSEIVHPNLVELHELFVEDEHAFFTMEVVEGVGLLDWLWSDDLGGPGLSEGGFARLKAVLPQVVSGLVAVHEAGRLHRDIKPSNIMVTWQGEAVLLDFGLTLALGPEQRHDLGTDTTSGTRPYMSPEQARGLGLGPPSDCYALGVVLYEALTGRLPFPIPRDEALASQLAERFDSPRSLHPSTPVELDALVCELLRADPSSRPSGREILRRLAEAPAAAAPSFVPAASSGCFVGREAELATLHGALLASSVGLCLATVSGRSGIGKSELLRRFVTELERDPEALVLCGRCRPQEWVPFKAFDGVIDALRRALVRNPSLREGVDPASMSALARLFPVLAAVFSAQSQGALGDDGPVDPRALRDRGFEALGALLSQLGTKRSLVLWIDDIHWSDADSVALARALLAGPDAPKMLLIATWQSELGDEAPMVAALRSLATTLPPERAVRLTLEPLAPAEANALAEQLLGPEDQRRARMLARESGGSPFFVVEVARWAQAPGAPSPHDLGELLARRLASLTRHERTLLTFASLAGRPVERDLLLTASGLGATGRRELSRLVAAQVLRLGSVDGQPALEPRHDRFRAAVLAETSAEAQREGHLAFVEALLARGAAESAPDALVDHLLAANEGARAAGYALSAADNASEALAFDRAAALYRVALGAEHPGVGRWEVLRRRAEALVAAGRGGEAAEAFMSAAEARSLDRDGQGWPAVDLRRMAAAQYACSGRYAEGMRVMSEVLAALGVSLPRSPRMATAEGVLGRLGLLLRPRRRGARVTDPSELQRLDALWSAVVSYSMVQPPMADALGVRHLGACLDEGDRSRVVRALGYEATCRASVGTRLFRRSAHALLAEADAEAVRTGVAYDRAWVLMARGAIAWFESRWPQSFTACDEALRGYRERCRGVAWEVATTEIYALSSLALMGRLRELAQRLPRTLRDAEERADLFAADGYVLGEQAVHWLALDQVGEWRAHAERAASGWEPGAWHLQRYQHLVASLQALLYERRGAEALRLAEREWSALEGAQLLRLESPRIELLQLRVRAMLATLAQGDRSHDPRRLAARCASDIDVIAKSELAWAAPLAAMLRGALASRAGDTMRAAKEWSAAVAGFDDASMGLFGNVTREALGTLMGGTDGRRLRDAAGRAMAAEGVRDADALGWCILPRA